MLFLLPIILIFVVFLLISSKTALSLASLGLTLWLENMVPTLLPFMLLSGILTGLGLQYALCRPLRGVFRRLFCTTENGAYCILMGFLCGFPMGAFCASDLYLRGKLTQKEAGRLLPFCNNIGPVYFYSFAIPLLDLHAPAVRVYPLLTFGMYGIPLLYGMLQSHAASSGAGARQALCAASMPDRSKEGTPSLLGVTDEAISKAGRSILRLCGYMILFNILMLPLYALHADGFFSGIMHSVLEISGGIRVLQGYLTILPAYRRLTQIIMLTALSFGGLCCTGQSYCFMDAVGLGPIRYLLNRLAIALFACLFYGICFSCGLLF